MTSWFHCKTPDEASMTLEETLHKHIHETYFTMRIGIAILALLFPSILLVGGWEYLGIGFQGSMSAYYHATGIDGKSMRDWYVGILWAMGVFLILYRGYSGRENWALNFAGLSAICVALFPKEWDCGDQCQPISVHGVSTVLLFAFAAFVSIFCASDTLKELENVKCKKIYRCIYCGLGALMILAPAVTFLFSFILENYMFVAETIGIGFFALYWLVKTHELSMSEIES